MLTPRQWVWMFATTVASAGFVTVVMFSLCHWLGADCRIAWNAPRVEVVRGQP